MKQVTIIAAAMAAVGGLVGLTWAQPAAESRPAAATSPAVLLEKGIYTEETVGDLDTAIKVYQQIIDEAKANRPYAAQAQYRLAMCYLKKSQSPQAIKALNDLIASFSDQKELVAKARKQIAKAREGMSDAEVAKIVADVVTDISTMADGDSRIPGLLQSLRELKEPAVVKELAKYFDSDKNTVRRSAVYILWKGEFTDASLAVPGLITLCSHEEDLTRGMAAIALGGLKAKSAFDKLAEMTAGDKSPFARRCAAYALGLLGDPKAKPILEKALKDSDDLVRNNAEAALTMLGKSGATGPSSPRVVKTSPAVFADNVEASLDKLSVTFDQKMADRSWAWVQRYADKYPKMTDKPRYDEAMTTCSVPVKLEAGKVYWIEFNSPPFIGFVSTSGKPAVRHALLFATAGANGKPTPLPEDLVKQAKEINEAPPTAGLATFPQAVDARLKETLSLKLVSKEQVYTSEPAKKSFYEYSRLELSWTVAPELAAKAKFLTILVAPISTPLNGGKKEQCNWLVVNLPAKQTSTFAYGQEDVCTVLAAKELKAGRYTLWIAAFETPQGKDLAMGDYGPKDKEVAGIVATAVAELTVQPLVYTQANFNDIDAKGTIHFREISQEINSSHRPITECGFINSDFVNLESMADGNGTPLKFDVTHSGNIYRYHVKFDAPVGPGEALLQVMQGTETGLVKREGDTFTYYMRHTPGVSSPTRRIEVYRLPPGAEVLETAPRDMARRVQNGRVELAVEEMIQPGGSITTSFKYRLASTSGGKSAPSGTIEKGPSQPAAAKPTGADNKTSEGL